MEEEVLEQELPQEKNVEESTYEALKAILLSLDNINEEDYKVDLSIIDRLYALISTKDTIRKLSKIEGLDDLFLEVFKAFDIYKVSQADSKILKQALTKLISNIGIDYYEESLNEL